MDDDALSVRTSAALATEHPARRLVAAFLAGRSPNTLRAYQRDLEHFAAYLGAASAEDAAAQLLSAGAGGANALVLEYRNAMVARRLQASTVNRRLSALRALVRLARLLGLVTWSVEVEGLAVDRYRDTRGPGTDAVVRMLSELGQRMDAKGVRDHAIVRLLHDTALRRGEICSLDLEHVDAEGARLSVLGKGRSARQWISLPDPTFRALVSWIDVRGDEPGPLFVALDEAHFGHRLTGSGIYAIVRELGAAVDVTARPHGLRHTAITTALERTGGDLRKVQRFSRHRDVRTVGLYDDARRDLGGEVANLVSIPDGQDTNR